MILESPCVWMFVRMYIYTMQSQHLNCNTLLCGLEIVPQTRPHSLHICINSCILAFLHYALKDSLLLLQVRVHCSMFVKILAEESKNCSDISASYLHWCINTSLQAEVMWSRELHVFIKQGVLYEHMYLTWPHQCLPANLYLYISACKC